MRYPQFLSENKTIGFVAPSFGCATEPYVSCFKSACKEFEMLSYKLDFGPNVFKAEGIGISNTPKACGRELTEMYLSKNNDGLISCGGGELMCEILPFVDFEAIKKAEPKWFLGYSDNTNFTFLHTIINDVATIYGYHAGAFGVTPWHRSVRDLYQVLYGSSCMAADDGIKTFQFTGYEQWEKESLRSEENPLAAMNDTEPSVIKCFIGDKAWKGSFAKEGFSFTGRLIGGCMDCLVNLTGTRFDKVEDFLEKYKEDGFIWFLESCDLNVFAIRRAMWQMENAGWFQHVKGFIIGRPLVMGQELMGLNQYDAVTGIVGKYHVPIVMDIDIGHLSPSMPMICGSMGTIRVEDGKYSVTMQLK